MGSGQHTEQCSLIRHRDKEVCSQLTSSHFDVMREKLTGPIQLRALVVALVTSRNDGQCY